jgi:multiple sugar transport system ATP-binding protein
VGRADLPSYAGRRILVGIRPEDLEDASLVPLDQADTKIESRCELREALGSDVLLHFVLDSTSCIARLTPRSQVQEGEAVTLTVDASRLHFFDSESGLAIGHRRPQ